MKNAQPSSRFGRAAVSLTAVAAVASSLLWCTSGTTDSTQNNNVSSGGSEAADAGGVSWPAPGDAASTTVADAAALPEGAECATDNDCVPAGCCHATACVPAARRPACEGVMCTMDCRPATLDCGGSCLCQSGRCAAQLAGGPVALVAIDAGVDAAASAPDAAVDAGRRRRR